MFAHMQMGSLLDYYGIYSFQFSAGIHLLTYIGHMTTRFPSGHMTTRFLTAIRQGKLFIIYYLNHLLICTTGIFGGVQYTITIHLLLR